MTGFEDFASRSVSFFADLSANNTRDWFHDNKARYEADIAGPAKILLDDVSTWLATQKAAPNASKIYRIHRDLRFSKDKTPYNTHLHMQWSLTSGPPIGFLFGLEPGDCRVGVGVFRFDKDGLIRWREGVDRSGEIADCIAGYEAADWFLNEPPLKRVPSPYDKDHPRGALLRRKGCVLWHRLSEGEQVDLPAALRARFDETEAFRDALSDVF